MRTFGINGFGRIGRISCRVWWQHYSEQLDLKMINTSGSMELEEWAHLLKYDSNYGTFAAEISTDRHQSKEDVTDENPVLGTLTITSAGRSATIVMTAQRDPNKLPWAAHDVEVVLESTGAFNTEEKAAQHLNGGAKFVMLSAPAKDGDVSSSVKGVNSFEPGKKILSNVSCTTNSVAPVMQVIDQVFGIEKAMLTTIHSYTDNQNTLDNSHKDLRRGRTAAKNIIPTTTGAAKATCKVMPQLQNRFDGMAMRVPTSVGSISDLVFLTKQETTVAAVNEALINAAAQPQWQGILAVTDEPIVSSDIVGRSESAIVDLSFTMVVAGNLVKILSWYDNEWGYSHRLMDQIQAIPTVG